MVIADEPAAWLIIAGALALVSVATALWFASRSRRDAQATADAIDHLAAVTDRILETQAALAGRLEQAQVMFGQRLDGLSRRFGDGILEQTERTGASLRGLEARLAVIDAAQRNLESLTAHVAGLERILASKQARGAFGEVQLADLISALLPPAAYQLQAPLGDGLRVDCLLRLPDPPGAIAIDAKFPLESFIALTDAADDAARERARRAFSGDLLRHVRAIADKYIIPGETADQALMFLPSEAVYAEMHARCRGVVEESFRRRVWIVSPTTLWATLHTLRAVMRDVTIREQAAAIRAALKAMADDLVRLDDRAGKLERHFQAAAEDIRLLRGDATRVAGHLARIDQLDWSDGTVRRQQADGGEA